MSGSEWLAESLGGGVLSADIVNQAVGEGFAGCWILPSVQAAILHDEWSKRDTRLVVVHADFRQLVLQKPGDFPAERPQLFLHGGCSRDLVVGEQRWCAGIVWILCCEDRRHTMTQQRQGLTGADDGNLNHLLLRGHEPLSTTIFSKNTLSIYLFYNNEIAGQINFLHVCCQKGDI